MRTQINVFKFVRLREDPEHLCADGGGAVAGFVEGWHSRHRSNTAVTRCRTVAPAVAEIQD